MAANADRKEYPISMRLLGAFGDAARAYQRRAAPGQRSTEARHGSA